MALTVNTNVSSLNAQRNLSTSQSSLSTSLQRLSSGLRINSAKDDAAGLSISETPTQILDHKMCDKCERCHHREVTMVFDDKPHENGKFQTNLGVLGQFRDKPAIDSLNEIIQYGQREASHNQPTQQPTEQIHINSTPKPLSHHHATFIFKFIWLECQP